MSRRPTTVLQALKISRIRDRRPPRSFFLFHKSSNSTPSGCLPAGLLQLQLLGNENIAVLSNGISSARTVASTMSVCLRGKTHCEH
jgi:hypothetical protein